MLRPDANFDPLLVYRLATELQLRVGIQPKVEVYAFHLEPHAGQVMQVIRAQPRSLSEICRLVRAARTMKLSVRGIGQMSGAERSLYADEYTVLVDCCKLEDLPRMELVKIQRQGEGELTQGLRVLAGVTLDELTDFLVDNNVELYQSGDINTGFGTVVGAVVSASTGVFGPSGGALGGCLADEVICMRIVDCRGELIEYSTEMAIREFSATLGLLGIVYEVTLRYRPLTICKVQFGFYDWCHLTNSGTIKRSIDENDITEVIYVPFNGINPDEPLGDLRYKWCIYSDTVILRTCKRLHILHDEDIFCHPRHKFHLIDPIMGPNIQEIISTPERTPIVLSRAFRVLKRQLMRNNNQTQYTPWAVNSFAPHPSPSRTLRFSLETGPQLNNFSNSMRSILEVLMQLIKNETKDNLNFGLNLCVRIQFTGGTRGGKLRGVGCLNPRENLTDRFLAHITLASLVRPGPNPDWITIASNITRHSLDNIPRSLVSWKTEWHDVRKIIWHLMDKLPKRWGPFKYQMLKRDRDGMFMNEAFQAIFFERMETYQREYREQRKELMRII
uniref:D-arabinono-1,4-lactone oxidase n=1 Tax=Schistocephalus solidus TaxID=70667 RepID=A0A0X3PZB9_SCHSO